MEVEVVVGGEGAVAVSEAVAAVGSRITGHQILSMKSEPSCTRAKVRWSTK